MIFGDSKDIRFKRSAVPNQARLQRYGEVDTNASPEKLTQVNLVKQNTLLSLLNQTRMR